jgi:hypothetical protein
MIPDNACIILQNLEKANSNFVEDARGGWSRPFEGAEKATLHPQAAFTFFCKKR